MSLVAAFALPHTPQLLVRPPTEDATSCCALHAALGEVKRRLTAPAPTSSRSSPAITSRASS